MYVYLCTYVYIYIYIYIYIVSGLFKNFCRTLKEGPTRLRTFFNNLHTHTQTYIYIYVCVCVCVCVCAHVCVDCPKSSKPLPERRGIAEHFMWHQYKHFL